MANKPLKILVCDCEGTNPIKRSTLVKALGQDVEETATILCRQQIGRFEEAFKSGDDLLVCCTQEAPIFIETADELDDSSEAGLSFVNIREKAGWSTENADAAPKMAALVAEAKLDIAGPGIVTFNSEGAVLILGSGEVAVEAANKLKDRLDVTLILETTDDAAPPQIAEVPIFSGRATRASGHLGAFEVAIDAHAGVSPSSRGALTFEPPAADAGLSTSDLILDLRGGTPLFPAPEKREGYFNPDPGDPVAVANALFEVADLVGEFETPRYVTYEADICAHGRNGVTACSNCLDNCPTGAITSIGEKVEFDPYICAGCGTCATVCPTGAAQYTMPMVDALLQRCGTLLRTYREAGGENPVLLVHDGDYGEEMIATIARHYDGLPANVIPVAVNAITQTGLEALLSMAAFGAGSVKLLAPQRPHGEFDGLSGAIELANFILGGLGYDSAYAELIDERDPEVLANNLRDTAAIQTGDASAPAAFTPLGKKRSLMSLALNALHDAAPNKVDQLDLPEGAPFGTVNVDVENCTLCLSCVGVCPANALRDNPEYPRLSFLESACVQCGLCVKTCPEDVMSLQARLDFTGEARNERTVKEEEPFECVRCGTAFGTKSSIEAVVEKMAGHAMFQDEKALNRLRMCADCRVIDMATDNADPYASNPRPVPRTTDDDLRERELKRSNDNTEDE